MIEIIYLILAFCAGGGVALIVNDMRSQPKKGGGGDSWSQ